MLFCKFETYFLCYYLVRVGIDCIYFSTDNHCHDFLSLLPQHNLHLVTTTKLNIKKLTTSYYPNKSVLFISLFFSSQIFSCRLSFWIFRQPLSRFDPFLSNHQSHPYRIAIHGQSERQESSLQRHICRS